MKHAKQASGDGNAAGVKRQTTKTTTKQPYVAGEIMSVIYSAISREADTGDDRAAMSLHCLRQFIAPMAEAVAEVEKKPGDAKALQAFREEAECVSLEFASQVADADTDGLRIKLLQLRQNINEALRRLKEEVFLSETVGYSEDNADGVNNQTTFAGKLIAEFNDPIQRALRPGNEANASALLSIRSQSMALWRMVAVFEQTPEEPGLAEDFRKAAACASGEFGEQLAEARDDDFRCELVTLRMKINSLLWALNAPALLLEYGENLALAAPAVPGSEPKTAPAPDFGRIVRSGRSRLRLWRRKPGVRHGPKPGAGEVRGR